MRLVYAALLFAASISPTFAQREPEIVIPGRPGVPVMINGVDASWGVVVGEFGLDRPGVMAPIVVYRPLLVSVPYSVPGYFPQSGRKPGYGRLEIEPPPNRTLPPPAPSYFRSWSGQSSSGPVTDYPPYPPPDIAVAPGFGRGRHWRGPGPQRPPVPPRPPIPVGPGEPESP
jgi:hypothetical protein